MNNDKILHELDMLQRGTKERGEELLKRLIKNVFDNVPELEAINWTQYIPTFNDGSPCVFETSGVCYVFSTIPSDFDDEDDLEGLCEYQWRDNPTLEFRTREILSDFNKSMDSDEVIAFLQVIFGEGKKIKVSRQQNDLPLLYEVQDYYGE